MAFTYNKLWVMLSVRNMSKADMRKVAEAALNTMTKMRREEPVHLSTQYKDI